MEKMKKEQERKLEYELIRSNRKSLAMQVKADGSVIVRAPLRIAERRIETFAADHWDWVEKQRQRLSRQRENARRITEEERQEGIRKAKEIIPRRAACFAARMGVSYGRITIREQKTRWGSCSSKGNLNFNWRLILAPEEVLDYVVVHELAHRREMNHSKAFYAVVEAVLPDYRAARRWLREHGDSLWEAV